jgi:hypothetical protein
MKKVGLEQKSEQKGERNLEQAIEQLPSQIMPERDLWRGIELHLNQPHSDPRRKTVTRTFDLATAASLMAVAFLGWTVWQYQEVNMEEQNDFAMRSSAFVEGLSMQHTNQLNTLLVKFEGQQAMTENWQQQLQDLDSAAAVIKSALKDDPANKALLQMLQHVYQQQLELVESVHSPKWQTI